LGPYQKTLLGLLLENSSPPLVSQAGYGPDFNQDADRTISPLRGIKCSGARTVWASLDITTN